MSPPRRAALAVIRGYQWLSAAFPRRCRFEPTCSHYAADAVRQYGILRGTVLAAWRVLRCHPLSAGGLDPVSEQRLFAPHHRAPTPSA